MTTVFDFMHRGPEIAFALAAAPTSWYPVDLSDGDLDELEANTDVLVAQALAGSAEAGLGPAHNDACRLAMLLGRQLETYSKLGLRPFSPASALSRRIQRYLVAIHTGAPELLDAAVTWPRLDIREQGGIGLGSSIVTHLAANDIGLPGMRDILRAGVAPALAAPADRATIAGSASETPSTAQECVRCGRWNFLLWVCGDVLKQPEPQFQVLLPLLLSDATTPWLISSAVAKGATLRSATVPEAILLLGLARIAKQVREGAITLPEPALTAVRRWEGRYVNEAAMMADAIHRTYKKPRVAGKQPFYDIALLLDTWSDLIGCDPRKLAVSFMQRISELTPSILGHAWGEPIVQKTAIYLAELGFDANELAPGLNVGRETVDHMVTRLLGPTGAAILRAHSHSAAMHEAVDQALGSGQAYSLGVAVQDELSKLGAGGERDAANGEPIAAARTRRMRI